jgi:division protein CdvB (Snf7/Vps24/ESCRT-III family)
MMSGKQDAIQLLNTAVIKSKEKRINAGYEERLAKICNSSVMNSILIAIDHLAEEQKMSKDQAAISIVETIRELDSVWNDYVVMEGIGKLKDLLKNNIH